MRCWLRWCASRRLNSLRRLTVSLRQVCCSGRACRRMRPICSSTPWCRTRPMARCCASRDARSMLVSPKLLESQFAEIAESQPELLARHCTEAGLIEKAAGPVGQGGTAVAGALGAGRSHRAAHARTRPDRDLARHARAAPRADQASGRAYHPAHPRQRLCCAGNQGGCGAGTSADRTSRSARRASRRPAAVVLSPLRLLGRELLGIQRRCMSRSCGAVLGAC